MILESKWKRNYARLLLAYIALKPGHVVSRGEVIEQFWPEANYQRARESLYTVLSSLRSTIGQTSKTAQFVLSEQGRLWFDDSLVHCDVDAVEQTVRSIMVRDTPDDELVARGIRLEMLYGNGSFQPSQDPLGKFRARHNELSYRFAEALQVSAAAAKRLGDPKQAEWFLSSVKAQQAQ